MTNFQKGDAVQLINGYSPILTVMKVTTLPIIGDQVTCCWFNTMGSYTTFVFDGELLKHVE